MVSLMAVLKVRALRMCEPQQTLPFSHESPAMQRAVLMPPQRNVCLTTNVIFYLVTSTLAPI